LKIPNAGVSGVASTAPLYECFCRSLTYNRATRTDARTNTTTRVVARAITAGDMTDCWLDAS
jgi:cytochrome c oxidase assembly protein Cox11